MEREILESLEERQRRLQGEMAALEREIRALKGGEPFQASDRYGLEPAPSAKGGLSPGGRLKESLASRRGFLKLAALAGVMGGAAFIGRRTAQADVPTTINYQGRLTDNSNNPLTGSYNMTFALYEVPTGGTALWTEARSGANAVPVNNGLFNVLLGSLTPIPQSVLSKSSLYLGITVGSDPEMTPRQPLTSVPFALQVADGSVSTAKLADGAVTSRKLQRTRYSNRLSAPVPMTNDAWYDLLTQTFTLDVASNVTIFAQADLQVTAGDTLGRVRILVDGSPTKSTAAFLKQGTVVGIGVFLVATEQLAAGSHTVKLQAVIQTYSGGASMVAHEQGSATTFLEILIG